ncbi:MAG: hypothetical protein ABSE73_27585, partial [Planctomycetota bacterium]
MTAPQSLAKYTGARQGVECKLLSSRILPKLRAHDSAKGAARRCGKSTARYGKNLMCDGSKWSAGVPPAYARRCNGAPTKAGGTPALHRRPASAAMHPNLMGACQQMYRGRPARPWQAGRARGRRRAGRPRYALGHAFT